MPRTMRIPLIVFFGYITLLGMGMRFARLAWELPPGTSLKPILGFLATIILCGSPFIPFGYWRNGYIGVVDAAFSGFLGLVLSIVLGCVVVLLFAAVYGFFVVLVRLAPSP